MQPMNLHLKVIVLVHHTVPLSILLHRVSIVRMLVVVQSKQTAIDSRKVKDLQDQKNMPAIPYHLQKTNEHID